jgi:cytochrome c-type biogenesis protein CcmF
MTMPIVLCLLFLMAVAPVLPWRRASGELMRQRLVWPAAGAATALVACVVLGARGLWPMVVFALAAFAGTSALRQLVLQARRAGPRGLAGRSGGGMVVHLGVVLIAVAFAASHAYQHQTELTLGVGKPAGFEGHTLVYRGVKTVTSPGRSELVATVDVDGHPYYPAVEEFALSDEAVPSPAVRSTPAQDVYLTLSSDPATPGAPASIGVTVEPLVMWLWIGGLVIIGGSMLALFPVRARRATPGRGQHDDEMTDEETTDEATVGPGTVAHGQGEPEPATVAHGQGEPEPATVAHGQGEPEPATVAVGP